jgi:phage head maturation protease
MKSPNQPMADRQYSTAAYASKGEAGPDGVPVYTFRMTTAAVDRQGEIVTVEGWDFTNYLANPVVLNSHQYGDIEAIVGRTVSISQGTDGWYADVRFNDTPNGRLAQMLVDGGDLRAVSVGFKPITMQYPDVPAARRARALTDAQAKALVNMRPDPASAVRHTVKELLEVSVVPVPANAEAVRVRGLTGAESPTANGVYDQKVTMEALTENVWPSVASAMYALLNDHATDDTARRRVYNGLERVYRALDKEPPAFVEGAVLAKWSPRERDGQFWENEPDTVAGKAGRVISTANEAVLRAAYDAMEMAEECNVMAATHIGQAENLIIAVLESIGVTMPPEDAEPPEGEAPGGAMPPMDESMGKPMATYNTDILRAFLEGRTR